jgi:archaeosine-15-forming tRNA-guanine transglycosylase
VSRPSSDVRTALHSRLVQDVRVCMKADGEVSEVCEDGEDVVKVRAAEGRLVLMRVGVDAE